jgi:phosphate-selective porin OprO/OprP
MNFNKKLAVAVSGAVLLMAGQFALADSTSDIVDALVGKGVLTEEEGKLISKGHDAAKSKAAKVVDKNGALSLSSADGKSTFAVAGRIQLDSRHYSDADGRSDKSPDGFDVRRAYLGVSGTIGKYYDYKVVANFANPDAPSSSLGSSGKSNQMDEAFFGINFWKEASFRFGQQKMPFSLEEQTSSRFTDFQERSMLNKMIPGKEIGVQMHGVFSNGIFYGAAISTGEGLSKVEANTGDSNDVIGRIGINIAQAMGNKDDVYHVAIAGSSGSQGNTTHKMTYNAEDKSGSGALFLDQAVNGTRDRLGLEGAVALGSVKLQSEYIRNTYNNLVSVPSAVSKTVGNDVDIDGYYVSTSWMITGEKYAGSYKGGKFDRITPSKNFNPDDISKGYGAWEVGARYSAVDNSDWGYTTATQMEKANAYTLGLKWIPSPYVRVLLNYVDTQGERVNGTKLDQTAVTLRTQMDF